MRGLLSTTFGLLFLFTIVRVQEGHAQAIDPLIDSPGKTVGSDFNGDGIHDIIVGADKNNDGGSDDEGAAYIFFGASNLSGTKALGGGQSADVTILGKTTSDSLGRNISSAGDVNGDGFDDFIVGVPYDDGEAASAGAAYVFFGASNLSGTKTLGGGQSADVTILGKAASDYLGRGVSSAGDVNGDGFDDVIVGADGNDDAGSYAGAAYIVFGASNLSGTKSLGGVDSADVTILGKAATDYLGRSVSGAGDVNGDGLDDVIVGAYSNNDGATDGGAVYVVFGASNLSGTKSLGGVDSADVTILGKANDDRLGFRSVSGSGDVNGDGFDDVIMGAHLNDDGASDGGAAYVVFGASNLSGTKDLGGGQSADVTILGKASTDRLGFSTSGAGDINDDGFDDVIVGAYQNNDGGSNNEGAAYIIFGASDLSGTKDTGNSDEDVRILGKASNNRLGIGVSGVGDVNGNGISDIIVGADRNADCTAGLFRPPPTLKPK